MVSDITWVNGVPRCGKTWVVKHFELGRDVIITTTRKTARNLKKKLASRLGSNASSTDRHSPRPTIVGLGEWLPGTEELRSTSLHSTKPGDNGHEGSALHLQEPDECSDGRP
ncbi:hypothetical protein EVAR_90979_1 [Eumeta japonica]|uniref:(+)RNA virus helicase C-terminal domain-containing protein n=1 Tax=Eumeta variegata TaxID=151549 RepID=A0A4C1Z5J3_EUMVA|nr:hypothetical protein EVAR_90979_1 [Eumeta japonica]